MCVKENFKFCAFLPTLSRAMKKELWNRVTIKHTRSPVPSNATSFLYIYSPQIQCKQNFCFRSIHSQDDNILAILCLGRFWKSRKTLVKKSNNSSLNMCFFRCFIPEFGFQSCIPSIPDIAWLRTLRSRYIPAEM